MKASANATIDEAAVLEIARQAVEENDGWSERATYEVKRTEDGSGWRVLVRRIDTGNNGTPRYTPGGHRVILITNAGSVTEYRRGR